MSLLMLLAMRRLMRFFHSAAAQSPALLMPQCLMLHSMFMSFALRDAA